jgi:hypothetical protein
MVTPGVAIATLMLAMVPHVIWLKQVNFLPFTYAASSYSISSHTQVLELALGYISGAGGRGAGVGPAMALLALMPLAFVAQPWRRLNRGVEG